MKITIRPATRSDLPAILRIYNEAVLHTTASYDYEPSTLEARTTWFEAHEANQLPVFVAEGDGEVCGWSALNTFRPWIGYRFTVENSVYVAADQRGQGVGKLLLPPLIEAARQRGMRAILAGIDAENQSSIRLHAAFGFERVAYFKQVGYKFDQWLDLVFMELLLPDQ